jgi:hypothetical protein
LVLGANSDHATTGVEMARKRSKRWLVVVVAAGVWWWRPFRVAVEGTSMSPALEPGDWLLAVRPGRLRRGAIVVVEHPERSGFELVKRLRGLPGDRLGALELGPTECWVTGDRPIESTDSRWFGPVDVDRIAGVVVLRYRPLSRLAWLGGASPGG